jgi:GAF domain-containing protein
LSDWPVRGAGSGAGPDVVEQLKTTLERAGDLLRVLEASLQQVPNQLPAPTPADRAGHAEARLQRVEADARELAKQLVESERQAARLMNMYVATYQLHASLRPEDVCSAIADIAVNLLGAKQFVLLLRREIGDGCEVALRHGLKEDDAPWGTESYTGGDAGVDASLTDGLLRMGPGPESPAVAVVPLRVEGEIVGVLVLLRLLEHKALLGTDDRDLLDLLSAHAASALVAARLFAAKDRRLRTYESLVRLARGE